MDHEDWRQRWREGNIGFHKTEVNPYLASFGDRLPEGARVLVPLSGKSTDMRWLSEHGHAVVGVDLAEQAARGFFEDHAMPFEATRDASFQRFASGAVSIYVGDFFALDAERVGRFGAAYDRAALVAIPPELRPRYVATLLSLLEPGARVLLVSFEYERGAFEGPPFRLPPSEVRSLFEPACAVEMLQEQDVLAENPNLQARGATWLKEAAFLITLPR